MKRIIIDQFIIVHNDGQEFRFDRNTIAGHKKQMEELPDENLQNFISRLYERINPQRGLKTEEERCLQLWDDLFGKKSYKEMRDKALAMLLVEEAEEVARLRSAHKAMKEIMEALEDEAVEKALSSLEHFRRRR